MESQLLETTTQLKELKEKQKSLEARNALLEKLTKLNQQTAQAEAPRPAIADEVRYLLVPDVFAQQPLTPHGATGLMQAEVYMQVLPKPDTPNGWSAVAQSPSLQMTIWPDREETILVQDIGKLSLPEFAKMYSVSTFQSISCREVAGTKQSVLELVDISNSFCHPAICILLLSTSAAR